VNPTGPEPAKDAVDSRAAASADVEPTIQETPGEHQRPTRATRRPPRYRNSDFETRFQPAPRQRRCRRIQKAKLIGHDVINKEMYFPLGRGEKLKKVVPSKNEITPRIEGQKATGKTTSTTRIHPK